MDYPILMELVSRLGTELAIAGAETYRIEESIVRVLAAYELEGKVYSVPNSLFITILVPDGLPITRLCRMKNLGTDLDAVEQYNALSRRICARKPAPEEALQWLQDVQAIRKHYSPSLILLGHMLVASGFCIFFGGTGADSLCAAFCGLLLGVLTFLLDKVDSNAFFQKISLSFLMAMSAYLLAIPGLTNNAHTVVIGTLMLLVPGILFTNALRDIIFGDINSGVNRVVTALLIAVAVAMGTGAAWNLSVSAWGLSDFPAALCHPSVVTCIASIVGCVGFLFIFNIHGRGTYLCVVGNAMTWASYCIVSGVGGSDLLCCFVATVIAATFSEVMARWRKYPAISYLISALLPLIPGSSIYYTAQQAFLGNMDGFLFYGTQALGTAGVMAVGILLVSTATRIQHSIRLRYCRSLKN